MMRCTKEVQRECKYSHICGPDCEVADDSECADFIMKVTNRLKEWNAVEEEYLRRERQAIQEECTT